jgi:hypothetical protein
MGHMMNHRRMKHHNRRDAIDDYLGQRGLQRRSKSRAGHAMSGIGFFALGLAAGSLAGMLFAPKRGKELRSQAKKKARQKMPSWGHSSVSGQEEIYNRRN